MYAGRVLLGPALFLLGVAGCRHAAPAAVPASPVVVEEVRLEGFDVLAEDVRTEFREDLPLRAGVVLSDEGRKDAGERAVALLQNHGYPYAQVAIETEPIDAARTRVLLRSEPGTLGFFGPVEIAGNRRLDDRVIRRRLAYAAGDPFSREAIELTQQRIGAVGPLRVRRDTRRQRRHTARPRADPCDRRRSDALAVECRGRLRGWRAPGP